MIKVKTKKINLLFRIRSMEIGGVQKVLLEYLKNLPKDKFNISLIINIYQGELLNEIPENIKVSYIGKGREFLSQNKYIQFLQLVFRRVKLWSYQKFPYFLYKKIKQKPDIEIAFETSCFEDVLNSPIRSSKKIAWLHTDLKDTYEDSTNIQIINLMKKFNSCIIVSQYAKNNLQKYYQIELKNSYIINNPINQKEIIGKSRAFSPKLPSPTFVCAGRLTKGKGCYTLFNVHKKLIDNGYKHYIFVLGDGPEKQNLTHKIKENNLEETYILLGSQTNPYPYFREADFIVHPSRRESYPMVILENLILNKPIISTNVGGIPEMIENGVDGVLVNYDEDEISQAMKQFLTDPQWVEKIKNGTKNADTKFDENKIYQQVTEVFEKVYQQK